MKKTRRASTKKKRHPQPTTKRVYLAKANDALVSFCSCQRAYIAYPSQLDCPWCGCGWLFACASCRMAFTFALGVEVDETWEQLARRDLVGLGIGEPSSEDINGWVEAVPSMLQEVEVGRLYVWFDGMILPIDAGGVNLRGYYARHRHGFVPQMAALRDKSVVENILSNEQYWRSNAVGPRRR